MNNFIYNDNETLGLIAKQKQLMQQMFNILDEMKNVVTEPQEIKSSKINKNKLEIIYVTDKTIIKDSDCNWLIFYNSNIFIYKTNSPSFEVDVYNDGSLKWIKYEGEIIFSPYEINISKRLYID